MHGNSGTAARGCKYNYIILGLNGMENINGLMDINYKTFQYIVHLLTMRLNMVHRVACLVVLVSVVIWVTVRFVARDL